jgi:hypothetical protein
MASKGPKSRKDELVIQEADGELLIYDLRANKAFCLNETSALIWKACDGTRSVGDLSGYVSQETKKTASDDLIWFALEELKKQKLLSDMPAAADRFEGMSRREVVKRIGLGTAIALPVIAGLIAPKAAHAASACVAGGSCTCNAPSAGRVGQACTASVPCADTNCRCTWANNGNANGICVV